MIIVWTDTPQTPPHALQWRPDYTDMVPTVHLSSYGVSLSLYSVFAVYMYSFKF